MEQRKPIGPPHTWPTLEELATSPADLWRCPHCGCRDWNDSKVADSRFDGVVRKRIRVCRNCNTPLRTQELPVPNGYRATVVPVEDSNEGDEEQDDGE